MEPKDMTSSQAVKALAEAFGWEQVDSQFGPCVRRLPNQELVEWNPLDSDDDAFEVVDQVHRLHPGWRFSLLGGDRSMGYRASEAGEILRDADGGLVVAEETRFPFGWAAEFFGHEDPRLNYGHRHGTSREPCRRRAICFAALRALKPKA